MNKNIKDEVLMAYLNIKQELKLENDYPIKCDPNAKSPHCDGKTIFIVPQNEFWNDIYQLSHEMMHLRFDESENKSLKQYRWFEEIICEAFSIYCLNSYAKEQYCSWRGYNLENMYLSGNLCKKVNFVSLSELNDALMGYKTFETRQYIHNLSLKISKRIMTNKKDFEQVWDYSNEIINENLITKDIVNDLLKQIGEIDIRNVPKIFSKYLNILNLEGKK